MRPTSRQLVEAMAGICALVHVALAQAQARTAQVEVFTLRNIPITHSGSAEVYFVDRLQAITRGLAEGLPKDPRQARQVALTRLQSGGEDFNTQIQHAARGLSRAAHYGIERVPAIVFDAQVLVYGVTDVSQAYDIFKRWRAQHGGKR